MEHLYKEQIITALESAWQEILDWISNQEEANFNQSLATGKWSAAETVYHLIKIARQINGGLKTPKVVLRGMFGKNNRQEKTYTEIFNHFNNLMKSGGVSPQQYVAKKERIFEKAALIERFTGELIDFKKHLKNWDEKSMSKYVLPHPGLEKITVREILYYVIWHTKHHLAIIKKQAEKDS